MIETMKIEHNHNNHAHNSIGVLMETLSAASVMECLIT